MQSLDQLAAARDKARADYHAARYNYDYWLANRRGIQDFHDERNKLAEATTTYANAIIAYDEAKTAAPDKPKYPPIGTVSHGTMRPDDLIPAFMDVLATYDPERHDQLRDEYRETFAALDDDPEADELDYEQCGYLLEALFDALQNIAPPYVTFGSHPGDGADYGFWPACDVMNDDAHAGDVLKVDAVPSYIAEVNDHGNVTLYRVTVEEVWSVV